MFPYMLFHPYHIIPAIKCITTLPKLTHHAIPHFLMKPDRSGIFCGNQGIENLVTLFVQNPFQSGIEFPADTLSLCLGKQVNGRFRAPTVGRPGIGGAGIGIAQDFSVFLPDQPGKLGCDVVKPLQEFLSTGDIVFKCARPVTIYELTLLDYNEKEGLLTLSCHCSSGTYIRTLCDDLGRALGCGAVMTALRRTMAAGYPLTACITIDEAKELAEAGTLADRLLPLETALSAYPAITVSAPQAARFRNGGALDLVRLKAKVNSPVRVYDPDGNCIAIGTPADGELKMTCLLQV